MTISYTPKRDSRFDHASDVIDHIESTNCALGCRRGLIDGGQDPEMPGGHCSILAEVSAGEPNPVPELSDDGTEITCVVREPM